MKARVLLVGAFLVSLAPAARITAQTTEPPYRVAPGLFDTSRPADLGLKPVPGARTVTIFQPGPGAAQYNNGVVLIAFKGRLYAQWQSSATDEDAPDTRVVYSQSSDGEQWSAPTTLAPVAGNPALHTSGGWWTDGETLVAYVNVWPDGPGQGGRAEYLTSQDGQHWSPSRPVLGRDGAPMNGIIEQDPHALPDGRIVTAFHLQPGLVATPCYTDDPTGTGGWTKGLMPNLPHEGPQSRELEPAWFARPDGSLVMVFRDQASSFRQLAAVSTDRGATWTTPVPTDMPDARSKQSAGNLPDGTAFLVNAPSGNRERIPLVLSLSREGRVFDRAFVLRAGGADLPPLRHPGKYKRPGYHYAKSLVWSGRLFVAYTTNKEDVQLTIVPLAALGPVEKSGAWDQIRNGEYLVENNTWNIAAAGGRPWKQSVFSDPATGALGWRWDFTGHDATLKTYPEIIYGRKPYDGYSSTTPRLPAPLAGARFRLEYDYAATATGTYNTTTDITFTDRADAGARHIRAKLMIWFGHQNLPFFPDKTLRRAVIAGRPHLVLIDPNHDDADGKWTYIALLPEELPARGELDLTDYFAWLMREKALQPDWFLASIETGSEIANGAGEVTFRRFVVH